MGGLPSSTKPRSKPALGKLTDVGQDLGTTEFNLGYSTLPAFSDGT